MPSTNPVDRYFPFYVKDWLSDPAVRLLTDRQRGWYIDLLAYSWVSNPPCSLPPEDSALAQLAGAPLDDWMRDGGPVKRLFKPLPGDESLLCSPKLVRVYGEASELHRTLSEAGKRGAEARAARRNGGPGLETGAPPLAAPEPEPAAPRELTLLERKVIRGHLRDVCKRWPELEAVAGPNVAGGLNEPLLQLGKRAMLEKGEATVQGLYAIVGEALHNGAPVEYVRAGVDDYLTNAPTSINAMHFRRHITPRKGEKPGRKPAAATNGVTFETE